MIDWLLKISGKNNSQNMEIRNNWLRKYYLSELYTDYLWEFEIR